MRPVETTATVDEHGRILVVGLPFAPGAEVEVTISPKERPAEDAPATAPAPGASEATPKDDDDIFAEMRPFMVDTPDVDDSREAIYTRTQGE